MRLGRGAALIDSGASQIEMYGLRTVPLGHGEKYDRLAVVAVWKKENLNPFLPMLMKEVTG